MRKLNSRGFTLIEMVMTTLVLSILTAAAIPQFIDFRTDAKNATTKAALGAMRQAIANASATIKLKEPPLRVGVAGTNPGWQMYWRWYYLQDHPNQDMLNSNNLGASCYYPYCGCAVMCTPYPSLDGVAIMDPATGIPENPWSLPSYSSTEKKYIWNGQSEAVGTMHTAQEPPYKGDGDGTTYWSNNKGWVYNAYTGEIWANTANNGDPSLTENTY